MYKRFRDSLTNPRGLVQYRKDKIWFVFLYLFLFALLMGTRTFIDVATYDGLSFSYQETAKENFSPLDGDCAIVSGEYSCDVERSQFVYEDLGIRFFLDSYRTFSKDRYSDERYAVIIHGEDVRFMFNGTMMYEQELRSFSPAFVNLDFSLQETDPEAFYETVFEGVSDYLTDMKWAWGIGAVFVEVLLGLLLFLFFAVVNSYFMYRRFVLIKFRDVFVMTVYASTALFVVLIFDQMFQFTFLITLLLIFIAFRQNSQLNDELMKRMMKHQMKVQQQKSEGKNDEEKDEDDLEDEEDSDKLE